MEIDLYLNISPFFKVLASVELFFVDLTVPGKRDVLIKWWVVYLKK
jgi:hypothetical protein